MIQYIEDRDLGDEHLPFTGAIHAVWEDVQFVRGTRGKQYIIPVEFIDDSEEDFECCADCDLPDACNDFGCAKKQGFSRLDDGIQIDWD